MTRAMQKVLTVPGFLDHAAAHIIDLCACYRLAVDMRPNVVNRSVTGTGNHAEQL